MLPGLSMAETGNTKGGSITVPLTSCLTGLDLSVLQIKTKIVSTHTADSKPVKLEVNGTVILPPLVFPGPWLRPGVEHESAGVLAHPLDRSEREREIMRERGRGSEREKKREREGERKREREREKEGGRDREKE